MDAISAIIGAATGLITALGTIWLKNRRASADEANDKVNNTIKLTEAMNSVIDTLEKELDATSKRISDYKDIIKGNDSIIRSQQQELHSALAKIHNLQLEIITLNNLVKSLEAKIAAGGR